jgi:hypothetical protein
MSTKSGRRLARDNVAAYHEARLAELIGRVQEALEKFRDGELDAFETDQVLFRYSRAAKALWKFCNHADAEFTASLIGEREPIDWWERAALADRRVESRGTHRD